MTSNQVKVFVINPNNWYNKGDTSNRLGLINALKNEFSNEVTISIETLTPREDRGFFGKYGVNVVESIFSTDGKFSHPSYLRHLITILRNMLIFLFCLFLNLIFKIKPALNHKSTVFLCELLNSNLIISSPGGFLQDYNVFSTLLPNLFELIAAKILKKPIIIYSQSVGPFRNRILRLICNLILNNVEVIILRESISKKYLNEANIYRPAIYVTADATFSADPPKYDKKLYRQNLLKSFRSNNGNVLIGVTVIGDYFLSRGRDYLLDNYVKSCAFVIDYLVDKINANFVFIPQVLSQSESRITQLILKSVKNQDHVLVISEDFSPEDVMKIVGCMDLLIGTRMHSNIFASIMNVPFIAIAYEHKTYGIAEMLGLEKWVIDIQNIDGHKLALKVSELYDNQSLIKKDLDIRVKKLKLASLSSAHIVRTFYERYQLKAVCS